jgi:type II secretory pathway pseudopilin PulG
MRSRGDEEAGYSLIEVLVAFTILAGAIIMGFQIFGDGLHRISHVEAQVEQLSDARLALETFAPLRPGTFPVATAHGRKLVVSIEPAAGNPEAWMLTRPYRARISDGDAKPLLETILFGPVAP